MKFAQQPHALMMVRPVSFGHNSQTSLSNAFLQSPDRGTADTTAGSLAEFDRMADVLSSHEIEVHVFADTASPPKPDAVFPNNWVSFHEDGTVVLYPMMAENRRAERRSDIIEQLKRDFSISRVIDLSAEEAGGRCLEGTGSVVFDHTGKTAYACRSPRTDDALVEHLCGLLNYQPVIFSAVDENSIPVYHTNVMMCVGEKFAVVCLDAIAAEKDQDLLLDGFAAAGKKVVAISFAQMRAFAGNMIEVLTKDRAPVVLLSETAFQSLLPGQVNAISQFAEMLPLQVPTIEKTGGGSVRCMVAGIYLPKRNQV
jgi:hypothetical protein